MKIIISNFSEKVIIKIKLLIICILSVFAFSSCSKDDNSSTTPENYYVKYVIHGNGTYGRFSNWTATTPQGNYTNSGFQVTSWTQTYGPVNKGFLCKVQIGSFIDRAPTIEIHVSKNQEPFALKVSNDGNSASYRIN
jgi:hypothetical protein